MKEEFNLTRLEPAFQSAGNAQQDKHVLYKKYSKRALLSILVFLLIQFGLILINNCSQSLQKKMSKWNSLSVKPEPLFGAQEKKSKKMPTWAAKAMLEGAWQKEFEEWFNTKMIPFRSTLIRFHNQILYTIFLKSDMYSSNIIVGKKRYLYEQGYVAKYCNLPNIPYSKETFDTWVNELQKLSGFFKQRGQHFIYMITPSKASYQPEYLPTCYQCDASKARVDYYGFTNTLKKRGFRFLDTSESILNRKKVFEAYMFPKGGIHWTALAGAFATRELMKEISLKHPLPELQFTYRFSQKPTRVIDMDLSKLLNVFVRPKHYPIPEVFFTSHTRISKKPIKVAIISGSFMFEVANILARTKLFDQIDFYFYWTVDHYRNTPNTRVNADSIIGKFIPYETLGIHPNNPNMYDDIFSADVVILEENESNLHSPHFKSLMEKAMSFQKSQIK